MGLYIKCRTLVKLVIKMSKIDNIFYKIFTTNHFNLHTAKSKGDFCVNR